MKTNLPIKWVGYTLLFVAIGVLSFEGLSRYMYPYGRRGGGISLPALIFILLQYSEDHGGWFPRSNKGAYDALQQLYPYCATGAELAGVTGQADAVEGALKSGKQLNGSLTSWVYVQGLRQGDPKDIAILWEARPGLYWNGRRNTFGGRAVLLIGGQITNVPAVDWESFLKQQEQLRSELFSKRATKRDELPQVAP